jgi:hypothetical protein
LIVLGCLPGKVVFFLYLATFLTKNETCLLNLAMGGQKGDPLEDTTFPNRFEVDYVRVYQKKD